MATKSGEDNCKVEGETGHETSPPPPGYAGENMSIQADQAYVYDDSQKLGYTGTVFVILNKMIGTGSMFARSRFVIHVP